MAKQVIYRNRFVIHLPTLDNDGKKIKLSLIQRAFKELERHFGGYTTSSYTGYPNYIGVYRSPDGTSYTDYIYIVYVDVENGRNTTPTIQFFEKFRDKYAKLFQQSELYIIHYPVTKI